MDLTTQLVHACGRGKVSRRDLATMLMATGAAILAAEPAVWLFRSWSDPVWNSSGWLMALACLGLVLWSTSSPRTRNPRYARRAWVLLGVSAVVRLASQLLGINVVGALTLACDVYAIALLLGTDHRQRPVSAFWLAALFVLALPLERVLQRVIGHGLQLVSADGACAVLSMLGFSPDCHGIGILLDGHNVLVDVPCSGARGLLTIFAVYLVACALRAPALPAVVSGGLLTLVSAVIANTGRIVFLALGLTQGEIAARVNVMEAPWHEAIGTSCLIAGALPVVLWARYLAKPGARTATRARPDTPRVPGLLPAFIFFGFAVIVVSLPATPVDVSRAVTGTSFPALVNGEVVETLPIREVEKLYFTQYGGSAHRARYGERVVLAVTTTSPLRHLHSPDECLRAIGHDVRYLGVVDGPMASGLYRSVDPDGNAWQVLVSFISDQGHVTTNVAHAVWLWMRNPQMQWTMVQRIRPWHGSATEDHSFDQAIARLFDLNPQQQLSARLPITLREEPSI